MPDRPEVAIGTCPCSTACSRPAERSCTCATPAGSPHEGPGTASPSHAPRRRSRTTPRVRIWPARRGLVRPVCSDFRVLLGADPHSRTSAGRSCHRRGGRFLTPTEFGGSKAKLAKFAVQPVVSSVGTRSPSTDLVARGGSRGCGDGKWHWRAQQAPGSGAGASWPGLVAGGPVRRRIVDRPSTESPGAAVAESARQSINRVARGGVSADELQRCPVATNVGGSACR